MPIIVTKNSGFPKADPMPVGLNAAVIAKVEEKDIPNFEDRTKLDRKIVTTYVNAAGQEQTRFYTPSLHDKSTLTIDLRGIGDIKGAFVPAEIDVEKSLYVGRQVGLLISEGVGQDGSVKRKIQSVLGPLSPDQKVPLPSWAKQSGLSAKTVAAKPATRKAAPKPEPVVEDGAVITDEDIPW